jgi:hypothetical protein
MDGRIMSGITIGRGRLSRAARRRKALLRTLASCNTGVRDEVLEMLDQGRLPM